MDKKYALGILGLGVMGRSLAQNFERHGHPVMGFDLAPRPPEGFKVASQDHNWGLDFAVIPKVWRAGCIIRASLLGDIAAAFLREPELPNLLVDPVFAEAVLSRQAAWREVLQTAIGLGIPMPDRVHHRPVLDHRRPTPGRPKPAGCCVAVQLEGRGRADGRDHGLCHAVAVRSERASIFKLGMFSNKYMQGAVLLSITLTLTVVTVPFLQPIFNTHMPTAQEWAVIFVLATLPAIAEEITNFFLRRQA